MSFVVKNNTVSVHCFGSESGSITLIPGNNELTKEQYDAISKHPAFIDRISTGKYSVIGVVENVYESKNKKPAESAESDESDESDSDENTDENTGSGTLSKFSLKNSLSMIEETFDIQLLEKWVTEDKRGKVLKAIKNQITKIKG